MMRAVLYSIVASFSLVAMGSISPAQMITTSVPFQQLSDSFYESNGITWSLRGPNFFANFNGLAPPPFGNFDPNSGLRTGFGFNNNGVSGNIGFHFGQGSSRSISSTTPSLTTMNGVPGSITSQTIRPFVTGITPVVGDYPTTDFGTAPGQQLGRTIQQSQQADMYRRAAAANNKRQQKALEYLNRGQRAESEGNLKMARANYRLALGTATGPLRAEVVSRMREHGWIK